MAQEGTTLVDVKNEIKSFSTKILDKLDKHEEEVKLIKKQVIDNKKGINVANDEIGALKDEVNKLKNLSKAKNIILYGVEDTDEHDEI